MSELEKAISEWESAGTSTYFEEVFALAARRLLNLTSPETIEKAAKAIFDYTFEGEQSWDDHQGDSLYLEEFRSEARAALAVLRSVEENQQGAKTTCLGR